MQIYRFRNCLLNTTERSVIKDDLHLELTTKTFDVLEFLVENAGKVLTKDEILGAVWSGNFVEESNLPVHISKLRKSLEESNERRFIETVQGTGYRFVAPVNLVKETVWKQVVENEFCLPVPDFAASVNAIAVLPLHNRSSDSANDYLADGLTEGMINDLSHIGGLRVIARNTVFRYKNKDADVKKIGDRLGVSLIITGRIRECNDRLIVSVELISVRDGTQVWGAIYPLNLSNLIGIQRKIIHAISENLVLANKYRPPHVSGTTLAKNSESYRLYLKGRYFMERYSAHDMRKAIDLFKQSALIDPQNVLSLAETVECYRLLYSFDYIPYSEFCERVEPILSALSPGNQPTDAVCIVYCDSEMLKWNFDAAAEYCKRALEINPNSLRARLRHADLLLQSRNFAAALEETEKTLKVDPLSEIIYSRIARLFYVTGNYEVSVAYLNDALELEPRSYQALALRGAAFTELGRYEEALDDFVSSLDLHHNVETLAMMGVVYARSGRVNEAQEIIKRVERESNDDSEHSVKLAHIYLALGRTTEAYEALELAYSQHESDFRALTYDPRWNGIRTDARFRKLVERVGLPCLEDE